ncbi:MAG: hypothetical protein ACREOY_08635 [Candidatus Dormibacteraceae bacterium]
MLVGLDWHQNGPSTVVVMRPDGSIISTRTIPATWLVDEHAVGAYMLVANDGSGKGWTVDATGTVTEVAPAAAAFLSPPADGSGWTPPLIVDSTTAVTVGFTNDTVTAYQVNLGNGAVKSLLTTPQTHSMGPVPLLLLDVSRDRKTVWVRKVTDGASSRVEIVGIDLKTGTVNTLGDATALGGEDMGISPDGKLVAAQEDAGVDSTNLAIRHLHVLALGRNVDSDVQGTAPYTGGQRSPSVLFAPGAASVAWWGGIDNGSITFAVNVAPVGGAGRNLYQLDTNRPQMTHIIEAVYWVDSGTLVVQTDSTSTPGVFRGEGLQAFTIDAATGAQKPLPDTLHYVVAVLS